MTVRLNNLKSVTDFLADLDKAKIFYKLSAPTADAIMVEIAVPGERWEVEFFVSGEPRVEVFKSQGVGGKRGLDDLFERFRD